uniref:Protein kinase domain-containing protein n=1 Tax=Favella ehrenbergii TaxID=182087 RepID=A0A7S3HVH1_9SPIT|mmetsp:Transcript_13851/g.17569  ORF Transcript_13851/g.17569 Transcript_13851/m.17569 type:complete len:137 (+) Transcript_13851:751-1161(+)
MDSTYKGVPADIFGMGVLLWILQFGAPPFNDTSAHDRNYNVLQRNADSYWRLHPCVRKWGEPIDEDFKSLLTSMLSADISKRPASIADVIQHPFFTKEDDLLDAAINQWTDSEALKTQFKAKLAELLDQNAANSED